MASHIRKDQIVQIISGEHKGKTGRVLRIDYSRDRVVVEGVNMVHRHVRPTRKNPQGGRIRKEAPIHLSNVLPVDSRTGKGTRVKFEVNRDSDGRVSTKKRLTITGNVLDTLKKAESE